MTPNSELLTLYRALANLSPAGSYTVPVFLHRIPWVGEQLQQQLNQYSAEPTILLRQLGGWVQAWARELTALAGGIGRNLVKLLATMVTAFAQGLIAGIGYAIVGIQAPVLLGALTELLSVVPVVGNGVAWGSLSVYLFVTGHLWKAVILVIWGFVLVDPTDNVLRPLLISNATHVPFMVVMFGVLGGMAVFGLVGAFVGPIILAIGLTIWTALALRLHEASIQVLERHRAGRGLAPWLVALARGNRRRRAKVPTQRRDLAYEAAGCRLRRAGYLADFRSAAATSSSTLTIAVFAASLAQLASSGVRIASGRWRLISLQASLAASVTRLSSSTAPECVARSSPA